MAIYVQGIINLNQTQIWLSMSEGNNPSYVRCPMEINLQHTQVWLWKVIEIQTFGHTQLWISTFMAIYLHTQICLFCSIPEEVCMTIYLHIDKPITELGYDFLCLLQINKPSTNSRIITKSQKGHSKIRIRNSRCNI